MSAGARWILIVVGLLVGNAIAVAVLIGVAGGDTGRRVLPDYYDRAVAWDATMAEARDSVGLGWSGVTRASGRLVEVSLRDRTGAPLTGATVSLRGFPRGRADAISEITLAAGAPGVYRGELPGVYGGLHDLVIVASKGGQRWVDERIVELARGAPR